MFWLPMETIQILKLLHHRVASHKDSPPAYFWSPNWQKTRQRFLTRRSRILLMSFSCLAMVSCLLSFLFLQRASCNKYGIPKFQRRSPLSSIIIAISFDHLVVYVDCRSPHIRRDQIPKSSCTRKRGDLLFLYLIYI